MLRFAIVDVLVSCCLLSNRAWFKQKVEELVIDYLTLSCGALCRADALNCDRMSQQIWRLRACQSADDIEPPR